MYFSFKVLKICQTLICLFSSSVSLSFSLNVSLSLWSLLHSKECGVILDTMALRETLANQETRGQAAYPALEDSTEREVYRACQASRDQRWVRMTATDYKTHTPIHRQDHDRVTLTQT